MSSANIPRQSVVAYAQGGDVPGPGIPAPSRPDALFYAMSIFIWTSVWRIQDIYPILGSIKLPLLILAAVIALFFMDKTPERSLQWVKSPILWIICGLMAIMVLGLPTSLWAGKGVTFFTRDYLQTVVLFVLLAASIRDMADLERYTLVILGGGLIYAGHAYRNGHMVDGRLGGLAYYDANDFGLLMAASLPFALVFLRKGTTWWKRIFALAALGFFLLMVIKTGSRGAFLALIAVALYITVAFRAIPAKTRIASVAIGIVLLLGIGGEQYWNMMRTILEPEDDYNMTSDTGRKAVWKRGMGYMMQNPILGTGVRTFPQAEGELSEISKEYAEAGRGIKWSVAHNSFVEMGAECGIIALLLFCSFFVYSIGTLTKIRVRPEQGEPPPARAPPPNALVGTKTQKAYAQMLVAAYFGFVVGGFFVSAQYFAFLYVLFALTVALISVIQREASRAMHFTNPTIPQMGPPNIQPPTGRPAQPRPQRPTRVHWMPSGG